MFYRRKNKNKNKDKNKDLTRKEESQKSINRRINANKSSLKSAITEYVNRNYAFSAIVKQSYFDFQVHEISIDGEVVHLTEPLTQEYEEKRRFLDLVGKRLNPYKLTEFVMCKENMTMKEALLILKISDGTPKLKMERIMTSETIDSCQDRRAITSQLVTIRNENFDVERLCRELKCQSNIAVGNFRLVHKRVKQGHLKGNRFIMALRKVIGYKNHIVTKLESLKNVGFINYNGTKCCVNAPMQLIGKNVLLQEWQTVFHSLSEVPVSALLSDLPVEFKQFHNISLARLVDYTLPQKVRKDIQIFDKSLRPLWVEDVHKFVLNLKSHNNHNSDISIETIPAKIRLLCIIAYQRFLWDAVVSKRLAKFGLTPIVGDLVYVSVSDGGEDDILQVEANNLSSNYTGDDDDDESSNSRHQWKVSFVNENNIHNYTIQDVVLPLPGYNITYPANEVADWYKDLLLADGLSETDFERSDKDLALENLAYNFSATYRPLILKPSNVKWRFERYLDKSLSLIPSDLDRMKNTQPLCPADKGGAYVALILELSLPTSSNVSMALREIIKRDVSAEFQTSLTDLLAEMPQKGAACWHKSYVKYLEKKTKRDQKRKRSVANSKTPKESNWKRKKLKRAMESQWKNRKLKRAMESASNAKESSENPNTTPLEEEQQFSNTNVSVANHAEKEVELKRKTSQALCQDSASSEDTEMKQIEQEPSCKSAPIALNRPTKFVVEKMKIKEEPGTSYQRLEETNNTLKASEKQIIFVDLTSD